MWSARHWSAVGLCILAIACVRNPTPNLWLPTAAESQTQAFGGWATVTWPAKPKPPALHGELIAVGPDRLWILADSGVQEVAKSAVESVVVDGYRQDVGPVVKAWTLGSVLAITNGYWSVFTIPIWAAAGSHALREAWSYARVQFPSQPWEAMSRYARFPQGLPAGVDLRAIQAKRTAQISPRS